MCCCWWCWDKGVPGQTPSYPLNTGSLSKQQNRTPRICDASNDVAEVGCIASYEWLNAFFFLLYEDFNSVELFSRAQQPISAPAAPSDVFWRKFVMPTLCSQGNCAAGDSLHSASFLALVFTINNSFIGEARKFRHLTSSMGLLNGITVFPFGQLRVGSMGEGRCDIILLKYGSIFFFFFFTGCIFSWRKRQLSVNVNLFI